MFWSSASQRLTTLLGRASGAASVKPHVFDPRALWIGVAGGATALLCCLSPVVLFLLGASTATEAITLGERLYSGYAWYFRGAGAVLALAGTILYLRRRRSCSLQGARQHWRTLLGIIVSMALTYGILYAATSYLAVLGRRHG